MASQHEDKPKPPKNKEKEEKDAIDDNDNTSPQLEEKSAMKKAKWPPFPSVEGPARQPFGAQVPPQLISLFKRLTIALEMHQDDQPAFIDRLLNDMNKYTLSISSPQINGNYESCGWVNHKIMPMAIRKAYRSAICQLGNHKLVVPITLADQHTSCLPCLFSYVERQISFGPWNHFKRLKCPNCPSNSKYSMEDLFPLWEIKVNTMLASFLEHIIPQWEDDIQEDIDRVFDSKKRENMHSEQIFRYMGYYYELSAFKQRQQRAHEIATSGSCVIMIIRFCTCKKRSANHLKNKFHGYLKACERLRDQSVTDQERSQAEQAYMMKVNLWQEEQRREQQAQQLLQSQVAFPAPKPEVEKKPKKHHLEIESHVIAHVNQVENTENSLEAKNNENMDN